MPIDRVILDFDNTLFDTSDFKVAMASSLRSLGVTDEIFWGTYRFAREETRGECNYSFERHVEQISRHQALDQRQAVENLQAVLSRAEEFLYPDAKDFLSRLISLTIPAILLTRGDTAFQQAKITACGVDRLVGRVIITEQPKIEVMGECLHDVRGTVCVIDDHLDATLALLARYPNIVPILKRRPDLLPERYLGSHILNFRTLSEIRDYLTIVHATNPHYADHI